MQIFKDSIPAIDSEPPRLAEGSKDAATSHPARDEHEAGTKTADLARKRGVPDVIGIIDDKARLEEAATGKPDTAAGIRSFAPEWRTPTGVEPKFP